MSARLASAPRPHTVRWNSDMLKIKVEEMFEKKNKFKKLP
jgi:hypothetical protein